MSGQAPAETRIRDFCEHSTTKALSPNSKEMSSSIAAYEMDYFPVLYLETSPTTTPIESISVQSSADALNKSLQDKFGRSDVAIAVINSTAIMRCRPDRNFSQANDIKVNAECIQEVKGLIR